MVQGPKRKGTNPKGTKDNCLITHNWQLCVTCLHVIKAMLNCPNNLYLDPPSTLYIPLNTHY